MSSPTQRIKLNAPEDTNFYPKTFYFDGEVEPRLGEHKAVE